jgi:hypothetical protein
LQFGIYKLAYSRELSRHRFRREHSHHFRNRSGWVSLTQRGILLSDYHWLLFRQH